MEEKKRTIAYKGFDENLCCKGFQYEVEVQLIIKVI